MGIFGDVLGMVVAVIGYIIVNSVIINQNQDQWDTTGKVILNLFPTFLLLIALADLFRRLRGVSGQ
jgi:hypothetical protein